MPSSPAFLHSPFRFRDCKLYVPDVLKGMVRHAAADIDPVLPQILILIAADKADAVPPRDLRKCLSNLSLFPGSHFSAFGEVPHGLRVEVEEGDHAGLNLPCERLCHPGEALNMPADRVPVIYYDRETLQDTALGPNAAESSLMYPAVFFQYGT